jgi:hypothetical protein
MQRGENQEVWSFMESATQVIDALGLEKHPEGGWYTQTWRDGPTSSKDGPRGAGSAIYYLLEEGQRSHWHKIDAVEIWHYHAGMPIELSISEDGKSTQIHVVGPDLQRGMRPQVVVPAKAWQGAYAPFGWSLLGCTVTPAFLFETFELAPKGWMPGGA